MENITILNNGITIITKYRQSHTVGLVAGVKYGSLHDLEGKLGLAHFFEHLMVSGSEKRPSMETVFRDLEKSGGTVQASTGKERTYIYANFLSEELPTAIDVAMDCLINPIMSDESIAREKEVISKEITMSEETIEMDMHQVISESLYKGHPLSRPIRGTRDSIKLFTREDILNAHNANYVGSNMIICAVGEVNHDELVRLVSLYNLQKGGVRESYNQIPQIEGRVFTEHNRNTKQGMISIGYQVRDMNLKKEAAVMVIDSILGNGPTSEIFKTVRTKHALAYGIKSGYEFYSTVGDWRVFVLCQKENIPQIEELVIEECANISHRISQEQLELLKSKIAGQLVISNESNLEMAKSTFFSMTRGRRNYHEELLHEIKGLDLEYVKRLASEIFSRENYAIGVIR
jgi:predicted Zn-dependent peptidase